MYIADYFNDLVGTELSQVGAALQSVADSGYNATHDILNMRAESSYIGDHVALNAALLANQSVFVTPEVGGILIGATVFMPMSNQKLVMHSGPQSMPWIRTPTMTGSTLAVGSTVVPAISAHVENIYFIHAGRGPLDYVEGTDLPEMLTNGESHLEMHGAQGGILRNIGGYGCVHGISLFGCAETRIENPFFYGGVWDPARAGAQECLSHIHLASGSPWGRNDTVSINSPGLRPALVSARRSVVVSEKTVQVTRRIGPLHPLWIRSGEDVKVNGGFICGGAQSAVAISPDTAQPVYNIALNGVDIDESNDALIEVSATGAYVVDGLFLNNCRLNGQLVTKAGISVVQNGAGANSLRRLKMVGTNIRATLGGGMHMQGVEGAEISCCGVSGYNCAASVDEQQGGIVVDLTSTHVDVTDTRLGGGANGLDAANSVDAYGITPNGTKYGLVRTAANTGANVTKGRLLDATFGLAGGGLSQGTFDADP